MKQENRANIWFLTFFVALSLPGVIILVHKKYTTKTSPALLYPDSMTGRLAYMVPLPVPPDATFFVPPLTRAWVDQVDQEQNSQDTALPLHRVDERGDPVPLLSNDHQVQITRLDRSNAIIRCSGLIWQEAAAADLPDLAVNGPQAAGRLLQEQVVSVPQNIREELMACGYPRPPKLVVWFRAAIPATPPVPALRIHFGAGGATVSTVTLEDNAGVR